MWLDSVADRRTVLCILDAPPSTGDELLRRVLTDFGLLSFAPDPAPDVSSLQMTQVLQRFLASLRALRAQAFIVIENAQTADSPTRQEIQRLSDLDPGVLEILLVTPTAPLSLQTGRLIRVLTTIAAAFAVATAALWMARAPASAPIDIKPASRAELPPQIFPPEPATSPPPLRFDAVRGFRVQVGAFRDPARADLTLARFRELKMLAMLTVLANGLRQVSLGPYLLHSEALGALEAARRAGFVDSVIAEIPPAGTTQFTAADRALIVRVAALAEKPDVRGLESVRNEWVSSLPDPPAKDAPLLIAIDGYLDAARRAQLALDRRLLAQEPAKK